MNFEAVRNINQIIRKLNYELETVRNMHHIIVHVITICNSSSKIIENFHYFVKCRRFVLVKSAKQRFFKIKFMLVKQYEMPNMPLVSVIRSNYILVRYITTVTLYVLERYLFNVKFKTA